MATALGDLISAARIRKQWRQADLAEAIGHTAGYIGQLEAGLVKRPRPATLEKLEQALGISREAMIRAMGMIGPPPTVDVMEELRRLSAMRDIEQQADALRQAPEEVFEAIDLVLTLVRVPLHALRLHAR
jgi:transcriptional regulator with XRE-family HTH domain